MIHSHWAHRYATELWVSGMAVRRWYHRASETALGSWVYSPDFQPRGFRSLSRLQHNLRLTSAWALIWESKPWPSSPTLQYDKKQFSWISEKLFKYMKIASAMQSGCCLWQSRHIDIYWQKLASLKLGCKFKPDCWPPTGDSKKEEYLNSFEFSAFGNYFYISFVDLLGLPDQRVASKTRCISQTYKIQTFKVSLLSLHHIYTCMKLFIR